MLTNDMHIAIEHYVWPWRKGKHSYHIDWQANIFFVWKFSQLHFSSNQTLDYSNAEWFVIIANRVYLYIYLYNSFNTRKQITKKNAKRCWSIAWNREKVNIHTHTICISAENQPYIRLYKNLLRYTTKNNVPHANSIKLWINSH